MKKILNLNKIKRFVLGAFSILLRICRILFFLALIGGMFMEALDITNYAKSLSLSVIFTLLLNALIAVFFLIFAFMPITKIKLGILVLITIGYISMYFVSEDMLYMSGRRQCVEGSLKNCPEYVK